MCHGSEKVEKHCFKASSWPASTKAKLNANLAGGKADQSDMQRHALPVAGLL